MGEASQKGRAGGEVKKKGDSLEPPFILIKI
jgi:hypothetical protein